MVRSVKNGKEMHSPLQDALQALQKADFNSLCYRTHVRKLPSVRKVECPLHTNLTNEK